MSNRCRWQLDIPASHYLRGVAQKSTFTPCVEKATRRIEKATKATAVAHAALKKAESDHDAARVREKQAAQAVAEAKTALDAAVGEEGNARQHRNAYLHYDVTNARYCCRSSPDGKDKVRRYVAEVLELLPRAT